jgi:hypothetical protein
MRAALALAVLLASAPAPAQERPSEEDLFGAPAATPSPTPTPTATPPADPRADAFLTGPGRAAPEARWEQGKEDPLDVGGLLYLRTATTWVDGVPPADWPLAAPLLLDAYLDARPNDRVRGFVLGRLTYDPTIATTRTDLLGRTITQPQSRAVLDQLYVNFDVDRTVFVTAGKQHVKWGTGRFWNPGDFLHPVRKNPLAQFDDRTGMTMVRAHLPWEARGWNLYGAALLEDLAGDTAKPGQGTLGQVGGAARAEVVLGGAELAASVAAQRGHAPRFGFDGSFALWELDVTAELALTKGRDAPAWRATGDPGTLAGWQQYAVTEVTPQAVVGVAWSWKYSDEDALTLGGEYFYNAAGYDDPRVYPVLIASPVLPVGADGYVTAGGTVDPRTAFTPFYLGRHYAGAFLTLPAPGRWNDTTLTFSALANLSDGSGLLRLDHAVVLNTYLALETFLAGHVGKEGGEFRLGFTVPGQGLGGGFQTPPLTLATPVLDLGVALRLKL